VLGSGTPGTGAGGVVVVEIATLLLLSLKVLNPIGMLTGIVAAGNPLSKSSMTGRVAASAGTVETNGDANIVIDRQKTSIHEKTCLLFFIIFSLLNFFLKTSRGFKII
jgi:hypothetical protein